MLGLMLLLGLSFFINVCMHLQVAYCIDDVISYGPPIIQRLWTTNATGVAEINWFNVGDPIYLRSNPDVNYPVELGTYRVYIFEGNIKLNNSDNGKKIPDDIGTVVAPPVDVTTDNMGHFGPTLIWNSATLGVFTIVLDKKSDKNGVPDGNYGYWQGVTDYREDGCTATPTPPSFFVVPEVEYGTLATLASFFVGLGLFVKFKKKSSTP
jgi:hypothetical protein